MNVVVVPILRLSIGIIWFTAAVLTAILIGPFQLIYMISTYILQPQSVRI